MYLNRARKQNDNEKKKTKIGTIKMCFCWSKKLCVGSGNYLQIRLCQSHGTHNKIGTADIEFLAKLTIYKFWYSYWVVTLFLPNNTVNTYWQHVILFRLLTSQPMSVLFRLLTASQITYIFLVICHSIEHL